MKDSTFDKYCLVVDEWLVNGWNGTKAYQKYYPNASDNDAATNFRKILTITEVSEYRDKKKEEAKEVLGVEKHEVLKILRDWLYFNPAEFIGLSPDEIKALPPEVTGVITGYEHDEWTDKNGDKHTKIKLKFMSKKDAAEMINKHIGFYEEHNKQKNPDSLSPEERAERIAYLQSKREQSSE